MDARIWGIAILLTWAVIGCGEQSIEGTAGVRLARHSAAEAKATEDGQPPPLQQLQFTLPAGWKSTYEGTSRWKITKDVPPDFPVVLIWSLPAEKSPADLISFSHTLQTSSALTEGKFILDRPTEQGSFGDGYYVVGKFRPRGARWIQILGLAMIRRVGGHTLIFEGMQLNDPELRQEVLDVCKSARF